jgi:TonB-linked SusC/RagA family outer membrane protein
MRKLVSLVLLHLILSQSYVFAQNSRVTGKVTDQDNAALPGVSILLSGTSQGTVTDGEGNFVINAPGNGSLVFSFIGYQSQTVAINNRSAVDVQLVQESRSLGELVVVGYGTQKKTDVTGALSVVSTREFAQQPITRLDQVLQGRAAGVQVTQSNGAPGGDSRVRVRGANSVLGNNDPLYVIDGFVGANYSLLNPADIESIQILKDAASTSIYGSRGANGVVIITTKKGTKGIKVTYEGQGSVSNVIKTFDILPAGEFAEIVNARAIATGSNTPFTEAQIADFKTNGGTDWQDLIYRKGSGQQQQVTVSGGNEKTSFLISASDQRIITRFAICDQLPECAE